MYWVNWHIWDSYFEKQHYSSFFCLDSNKLRFFYQTANYESYFGYNKMLAVLHHLHIYQL